MADEDQDEVFELWRKDLVRAAPGGSVSRFR